MDLIQHGGPTIQRYGSLWTKHKLRERALCAIHSLAKLMLSPTSLMMMFIFREYESQIKDLSNFCIREEYWGIARACARPQATPRGAWLRPLWGRRFFFLYIVYI